MLETDKTRTFLPTNAPRRLGKYALLEQVGVGAYGTVCKARDTELRHAYAAHKAKPLDNDILNTLGVAQYRTRQYASALETLRQSDQINSTRPDGNQPADLAFLAMTQYQLGQVTAAHTTLSRLREVFQQVPQWGDDADAQSFLRETESIIEGDSQSVNGKPRD